MKVLLLNQTFYPDQVATAQQTLDLALFLTEQGHQVTILAARRSYENPKVIRSARENYRGLDIVRVGSTGFGKRSFLLRVIDGLTFEFLLLWKLLFFPAQDVVVSFTSPPLIGLLGVIACRLRGGRCVQWLMDVNPDAAIAVGYLKKGGLPARFLNWIFGQTLRHSDDIVVLDRWMKERIVGHGADPDRVSIVPPWPVDEFAQIDARTAGTKFRQELRIDGKFVVLYSGNHSVVHPLDTLMEAAVQLKDDPSVQFLFIGGGLRVAEVTECVKRHELKHVLQIAHQPRERLAESLFSADLHVVVMGEAVSGLVHTSKIYGILSTGIPYVFIGPRRSHVVDLLQECPYGFHVEHGNASGLVQAIRKAQALKPAERAVYSRENRQFVTSRYSARKSMSLFAEEVLGHPARQTDPVLRSSHG